MKKFLAFLLVFGMLLPMGLVTSVSGAQTAEKPFYLVNIHDDITDYDNIYQRINFNTAAYKKGSAGITIAVDWQGQKSTNITKIAQIVKEEFDARPEGTRYIDFPKLIDTLVEPKAMIYMDEAAHLYSEWMEQFFSEYNRIGGKLDGVMLDVEYNGIYGYYINKAYKSGGTGIDDDGREVEVAANKQIYNQIVAHPNYATRVRPKLEERGFQFSTPSGEKSEIYGISERGSQNEAIWNAVTHNLLCEYIDEACAPVLKYYPDALITNYIFSSSKSWYHSTGQKGGVSTGGNTNIAGTVANQNFYVRRPFKQFYETTSVYNTPSYYNEAVYEDTSYNSFMFEVNTFKDMYASMEGGRISAWISGFNYDHSNAPENNTRITPYYSETIFHIGLLNPELFLGYIVGPRDTDIDGYDYEDNMKISSELLNELSRLVGTVDRKAISVPTNWNSEFVLSGMYSGGRNVWRITPNTLDGTSLASFKVKDQAPTFKIGGQTIIFPQGRIIKDSKISIIGTCGYWIETPANVTPIIINDADRYEQYPAYQENFESYDAGMTFSKSSAQHQNAWETSGTLTVKNQGSSKMLAMTGNTTLKNVKLPQNVTAGDSFAKQQVWEVKVIVPESGTMKAFSCADKDGGIKITNGKVYYDEAGSYKELAGVTLSAGSVYTISREVDFRTANGFKSSYAIYDANGKRLGGVDNVAMVSFALPVTTISFSTAIVSGTAYMDDYTLRAIGVTTDFKLYDVHTGIQLTDTNTARTKDTAYRVSWMNASSDYKVVKVLNNGTVVAQTLMAPGADGVLTGIVKGNSKLTVTTENGSATTLPNYDNGNFNWVAGEKGDDEGNNGDIILPTPGTDATNPSGGTDTTNPSGGTDTTNPSGGTDTTNPSGGVDTTNPGSADSTNPSGNTQSGGKKGLPAAVVVVVVALVVVVLGGVGFTVYRAVSMQKAQTKNEEQT